MQDNNIILQMRFPQKLWHLLNLRSDAILWGGTGRTILLNYKVLHNYLQCNHSIFKTTNISSFVRQLNLYGFRKVTSHLQDPLCNSSNPYMHEYVHDYFQFGRPELLNKITRKALTIKKNFKVKSIFSNEEEPLLTLTPLQKARQALHVALKKASQDLFVECTPKHKIIIDCEGFHSVSNMGYCEEVDNTEMDWFIRRNNSASVQSSTQIENEEGSFINVTVEDGGSYGTFQEAMINFTNQESGENFPNQFLSMPELDPEPSDTNAEMLLAEFNIGDDSNTGIAEKIKDENNKNSLNCVLPSVSHEQTDNEEITTATKTLDDLGHVEWDQMFNDIITHKNSINGCGSELKELYSQISKTIDLLNS